VDGGEKDERKERVEGRNAAQAPESVDRGEDEEMRPEREKLASAVGGVGGESEGDDGAEEGSGKKEEGGDGDCSAPTHSAKNAEWMGHPEFYFPPIAMRLRWMGHPLVVEKD
jgi:hypothetical protein